MISFEAVSKRYGNGAYAVENLNLTIDEGELCVLVGPSGGGKTTILRMINRMEDPTSGRILVDGRDIAHLDRVELRRRTGYVIQESGLFPHLNVADNIAAVPRLLGWDRSKIQARVEAMLDLVGLDPQLYKDRYPNELSGGQAQRVGVARALAGDPPVLLMDEPFGAIDPIARDRLQQEFLQLHQQLHKTVIFVTHDVDEAVIMGDKIAVLSPGGVLQQYDTPAHLLDHPATPFVADFMGADRGLRRLAVTPIDVADLYQPPVVRLDTTLASARSAVEAGGTDWAAVLSNDGRLLGWIDPKWTDSSDDSRTVSDFVRPLVAHINLDASLKAAFAEMLQHDAAWIAVFDRDHYLGVLTPDSLHAALRRSMGGAPITV